MPFHGEYPHDIAMVHDSSFFFSHRDRKVLRFGPDAVADARDECQFKLEGAIKKGYAAVKRRHVADQNEVMNRVTLRWWLTTWHEAHM